MNVRKVLLAMSAISASAVALWAAEPVYRNPTPPGQSPTTFAQPRDDWYANVQQKFDRYSGKPASILFDGDSITNRWETTGRETWTKRFAGKAADFGIEGDRVENVLWRLAKGQADGVDPRLVVLMIGTNNTGRDSAQQIADGIAAVVREYRVRCPRAHVVVMGVFPRGATPDDGGRKKVAAINAIIAKLADGEHVSYLDIGPKFLEADGTISPSTMPDYVHPTAPCYEVWADALQPFVDRAIAQK